MIEAHGLARTFGRGDSAVHAVAGVDIQVAQGEIVGFLGPNGAGKTTTLRMLTTLLTPTAGSATVVGHDLVREPNAVRRSIGYVQQGSSADRMFTAREDLLDQAEMYGIRRRDAHARVAALLEQLDLVGIDDRRIDTLSGGQRRRFEIASGLVHDPPLLFLDEPTTGLDPQSRANLWEHVRSLRSDTGTTVFLTTHYLEEADALCDRVLIIDRGTIIKEGTPDELKRSLGGDTLTVEVAGSGDGALAAIDAAGIAHRDHTASGSTLRVTVEHGDRVIADVIRALDAASIDLASIQLARPSLDDVFLTLTGRSLRD